MKLCFMKQTSTTMANLTFRIFLVSAFLAVAMSLSNSDKKAWEEFKMTFKKTYRSETEEIKKLNTFLDNIKIYADHNAGYAKGEVSYEMGVNEYSDMTPKEMIETMTGLLEGSPTCPTDAPVFRKSPYLNASDEVDWRKKGAVTPVKDQLICGSSWAFSATGALEGQHFIKNGELVSLSEQNIVDCDKEGHGCNGGWPWFGFRYVKNNKGIDTEASYPYKAVPGQCNFKESGVGATDHGFKMIKSGDEEALKQAVAKVGPISVCINIGMKFVGYKKGVYYEPNCNPKRLNLAVLVVGYGTENGKDYWLVKNSWGKYWGHDGYIKMSRNRGNNCGIASSASYPLV